MGLARCSLLIFDVIIMKVLLLCLFVTLAVADDCYEPRPEYCAKNTHLCKAPGFEDFMKKMCPRHCGYCNQEDVSSLPTECVEDDPAYCAIHAFRCHQAGFEETMKRKCPRTCRYCYYESLGDGCVEPRPEYCARNAFLC